MNKEYKDVSYRAHNDKRIGNKNHLALPTAKEHLDIAIQEAKEDAKFWSKALFKADPRDARYEREYRDSLQYLQGLEDAREIMNYY